MTKQAGFGLIEVVVSAGILATVVAASVGLMNQSLKRAVLAGERTTAMGLASEGLEQVRMVRDSTYVDGQVNAWSDWAASEVNQLAAYHVDLTEQKLVAGPETLTLDGREYVRTIKISLPEEGYAVTAGLTGVDDASVIRKVTVTVVWGPDVGQSLESITYLTDWRSGV